MSLDLSLQCKCCHHYTDSFNYTWNVGPIWRLAVPSDEKMVDIDDMTCEQSLPKLNAARTFMIENREACEKLNPTNGWGSYEGFLEFISKLIIAAESNLSMQWRASR